MLDESTDEQLMLAFGEGEARAFEELVRRHRAPVFHFLVRLCQDRTKAEDLLQETWLRVVRACGQYQSSARFTTWLYTLARNLFLDDARRKALRKDEPLDEARADALAGHSPSPERAAQASELRPLLEEALRRLPTEQREVFLLREYAGIAFKEIAAVTSTSESTVKSRMRYALESLRRELLALGVDGALLDDCRMGLG